MHTPTVGMGAETVAAAPAKIATRTWLRVGALGILLMVAFWPILLGIYGSWFDEHANMQHGLLVLPAAAYMAWSKRDRLSAVPAKSSVLGLLVVGWGALQALLAEAAHWVWAARMSFLISLVGCIALLWGWRMVRELAYPLCTLLLMITPPTFIFERLTLSLQLLASKIGAGSLEALGFSVLREGNILELVGTKLSVEEACSGIRSLFAILFLCALYNFFFVDSRIMRALMFIMAVPIAILGNAGRIIVTGIASQYDRALMSGTPHETLGYISITLAGIGCIGLHLLMISIQRMWRSQHA